MRISVNKNITYSLGIKIRNKLYIYNNFIDFARETKRVFNPVKADKSDHLKLISCALGGTNRFTKPTATTLIILIKIESALNHFTYREENRN